jgi:hypothetical protein
MKWLVLCCGPNGFFKPKAILCAGIPSTRQQECHVAGVQRSTECWEAFEAFEHSDVFFTDQVQKGNITIEYCPTYAMTGDSMTKPLHGKKFSSIRNVIMNLPMPAQMMMGVCLIGQTTVGPQECVRSNESKLDLKYPPNNLDLKYLASDPEEASKDNEEGWTLVEAKGKRRSTR